MKKESIRVYRVEDREKIAKTEAYTACPSNERRP